MYCGCGGVRIYVRYSDFTTAALMSGEPPIGLYVHCDIVVLSTYTYDMRTF